MTKFFSNVRKNLFNGKMTQPQVDGINAIITEHKTKHANLTLTALAYILATAHHETGTTFEGVEEWGKGKGKDYGRKIRMDRKPYTTPDKLYFGRGLVQLTWFENYEKAGKKLGLDLLNNPELALNLDNGVKILFLGMIEGWFTSRKLGTYFTATKTDFINARRIVNGKDKAHLIAGYANKYLIASLFL